MKIPKQLPQFNGKMGLIMACGIHTAVIYSCHHGNLKQESTFTIPNPKFSDREGFFMHGGKGKILRSGSVYEDQKEEEKKRFTKELTKELKKLESQLPIADIYIFAPSEVFHDIYDHVPKDLQDHVKGTFTGNYTKEHPLVLLRKIEHIS